MPVSHTDIPTADGARLIKRLCAHWGHKFEVAHDEGRGRVDFGDGTDLVLVAEEAALAATLATREPDTDERMRRVVAEHLQRMARGETLEIVWNPA